MARWFAIALGAALGTYGQARQKLFPETSVYDAGNPGAFFGSRLDSLSTLGFNGKVGVQYEPLKGLTLALAYTSRTPLNLDGGRLTVNYSAIGLGQVEYRNASLRGLALPQEAGFGATYRLTPGWLIGAEFNWIGYTQTLDSLQLTAGKPDNSAAPVEISASQALDFSDVYVLPRRSNTS